MCYFGNKSNLTNEGHNSAARIFAMKLSATADGGSPYALPAASTSAPVTAVAPQSAGNS